MADEVTFDFINETYGMERISGNSQEYNPTEIEVVNGPVTLTVNGKTRLWADGLRFYVGSGLKAEVTGANVTGIAMTGKNGASALTSKFSFDPENDAAAGSNFWNGSASVLNMSCTITSSNQAVGSITVYYEPTGGPVLEAAGLSFPAKEYTVLQGETFAAPALVNPNNLTVAWTSSNETVATVDANGAVTVLGAGSTVITAASEATDKFKAGSASYTLTVAPKAGSIAQFLELCPNKGDTGYIDFPMTVVYVNGLNVYMRDDLGAAILFYGANEYQKGDRIAKGWTATYDPFNGLPEIKVTGNAPETAGNTEVFYEAVETVGLVDVNRVVILADVTFEEATPETKSNFTGSTPYEESITFRNNFTIPSVEAGKYNVLCAVAVYNGTLQVYPIEYIDPIGQIPGFDDVKVTLNGNEFGWDEKLGDFAARAAITPGAMAEVQFSNVPEGYEVYVADYTEFLEIQPYTVRRAPVSDLIEMYGAELCEEGNTYYINAGQHYLIWWFAKNGQVTDTNMPDGEGWFIADDGLGDAPDYAAINVLFNGQPANYDEAWGEYMAEEKLPEGASFVISFENLPENCEVWAMTMNMAEAKRAPRRMTTADLEDAGFYLCENNEIVLNEVGEHMVQWVYVVNGAFNMDVPGVYCGATIVLLEDEGSAVAALEAAGAEEGYYTLDGVRIAEGAQGLCIRVKGGKAQTVIVRK